jgi:hypothetical protein
MINARSLIFIRKNHGPRILVSQIHKPVFCTVHLNSKKVSVITDEMKAFFPNERLFDDANFNYLENKIVFYRELKFFLDLKNVFLKHNFY